MFYTANAFAARNPWTTAVATTALKTTLADVMTQQYIEGKAELDFRRMAVFGLFGASYQGAGQYFIWNYLMVRWLPTARGFTWAHRVFFVNAICDPLFFFPTFYSVKWLLTAMPKGRTAPECIGMGLVDYRCNCLQDWMNSWAMWVPGHCVTANLPPHLRVPWVAALSFGYCCILSATRGEITEGAPSSSPSVPQVQVFVANRSVLLDRPTTTGKGTLGVDRRAAEDTTLGVEYQLKSERA
jgi:hypothetical protein